MVRTARREQGVSIIEVVLASLLLSLGLMGLVRTQTESLNSANTAYNRVLAAVVADSLVEKMRVNRAGALNLDYNFDSTASTASVNCFGPGNACDSADLAIYDLFEWSANFKTVFPSQTAFKPLLLGATATVVGSQVSGVVSYVITITWPENPLPNGTVQNEVHTINVVI